MWGRPRRLPSRSRGPPPLLSPSALRTHYDAKSYHVCRVVKECFDLSVFAPRATGVRTHKWGLFVFDYKFFLTQVYNLYPREQSPTPLSWSDRPTPSDTPSSPWWEGRTPCRRPPRASDGRSADSRVVGENRDLVRNPGARRREPERRTLETALETMTGLSRDHSERAVPGFGVRRRWSLSQLERDWRVRSYSRVEWVTPRSPRELWGPLP